MKITLLIFLLIAFPVLSKQWEGILYEIDSPTITVEWECNTSITSHYDVSIYWEDHFLEYPLPSTTECRAEIPKPRSGHFSVMVRACNITDCSVWANSGNDSIVSAGFQKAWRLFWKVTPPEPPVVVKEPMKDRHLEPILKDINGKIIVPPGGFKAGIPAAPSRIRLVQQAPPSCDISNLKEGMFFDSNNPDKNITGVIAILRQTNEQGFFTEKILQYYLFPKPLWVYHEPGTVNLGQEDWLHLYFRFADWNLDPCVPNGNSVFFRYVMLNNEISYNSYMVCFGTYCQY